MPHLGGFYGNNNAPRQSVGTETYASIEFQLKAQPEPVDEIQAMIYVLLSLFHEGELPWSHCASRQEQVSMKRGMDMENFAETYDATEVSGTYDMHLIIT
jgi:hypothetical protein